MWNLKHKANMNITEKKQIHRYRKQMSGYQWGERRGEGEEMGSSYMHTTMYKVNKLQGYIVLCRECSQYFI